jgi:hypothetical protein
MDIITKHIRVNICCSSIIKYIFKKTFKLSIKIKLDLYVLKINAPQEYHLKDKMKPYHDYVHSCLPACGPRDHQHTAQVSEQTFGEEMPPLLGSAGNMARQKSYRARLNTIMDNGSLDHYLKLCVRLRITFLLVNLSITSLFRWIKLPGQTCKPQQSC